MKVLFTLLLASFSLLSFGQTDFDYHRDFKTILAGSQDSSSTIFYPRLLDRFHKNDTTLTETEILSLMIGFTANEYYTPYQTIDAERIIIDLVMEDKYEEAILLCDSLLQTNPLNYTALLEKGFSMWKLEKEEFEFYREQYLLVLNAILYSGDGSKENAFFVLSPIDGQTMIRYAWGISIGMMGSGSDENGNFLDILEMIDVDEEKERVMLHFNIQHAVEKM